MIHGINPTVDYAFKYLFGRDATRPILSNLVEAVLNPPPGHHITDLDLLNPFNSKETPDDKLSILDIKARDQTGRQFNIEMQLLAFRFYEKRILYYWSKLHQQQFHEGEDYVNLRPTITISFLNHILFPQLPGSHFRFKLLEQNHHVPLTEDIEFHVIELPKFTKTIAELTTDLDKWLYFLRYAEKMDRASLPSILRSPILIHAMEELEMLSQTDVEREQYEARRKFQLDYNTGMKVARMEGREEGKAEGIEEGLAKGIEKGKMVGKAAAEAKGMMEVICLCQRLLNRPVASTEELARLPADELTQLSAELQSEVLKNK